MTTFLYVLTLCLPLATVLLVFGMRYRSAIREAQARLANDGAYRDIAEKAVATQSDTAAALSAIQSALADVRTRLASVEKILKDVE